MRGRGQIGRLFWAEVGLGINHEKSMEAVPRSFRSSTIRTARSATRNYKGPFGRFDISGLVHNPTRQRSKGCETEHKI